MSSPSDSLVAGYLDRGWSIVPVVPGEKRPATPVAKLLSGEERIAWSESLVTWNDVGIVTGPPSKLLVVDADPRNGADLTQVSQLCRGTRYVVQTGGGGLHFYFQYSGDAGCGKTGLPGVDRKAAGGYVVAPPSTYGCGYTLLSDGPLGSEQDIPSFVFDRPPSEQPAETDTAEPWVAGTLANPDQCMPGSQDDTLTRLAWWAAGCLPEDIASAILMRFAEDLPLGDPRRPWTEQHIEQKLSGAYAKREPDFEVRLPGLPASATAPRNDRSAFKSRIRTASSFTVEKRDDWIVEHLVAPGCYTEIVGEVKKGKTTFNMQIIRSMLRGEPFLGCAVRPTKIVLYTEQMGLSLEKTLDRAGIRQADDLYLVTQADAYGLPWNEVVAGLLEHCTDVGAQLLFVDTLTRLSGLDGEAENAAGVVSILNPFSQARALGIGCVFVRHSSKSKDNRDDVSRAGRGSTALSGDMDICALLYQPGREDVRRVKTISRLGEEWTVLLEYKDGLYSPIDEDAVIHHNDHNTDASSGAYERIEAARSKLLSEGGKVTITALAEAAQASRTTVRKYLQFSQGGLAVTVDED